ADSVSTNFHTITVHLTSNNTEAALGRWTRFDRVERVHDQVKQDLLNLHRHRFHLRKTVIHLGDDHAFTQHDVGTHQPQGIRDHCVEIEHTANDRLIFPHQRSNATNDFAGALTISHHVLQQLFQ